MADATSYTPQINIPAILIANGIGVCLMLIVLLGRRGWQERGGARAVFLDMRLFRGMCWLCLSQCLLETAMFLLDGRQFPGAAVLFRCGNLLIFILCSGLAFLWVCYVDYKLYEDRKRLCRRGVLLSIPMVLVWLLSLANLFMDVFFGMTGENEYFRTPLFPLLYVVIYGYLTYGAVLLYSTRKRVDKYLYIRAMTFLIPVYVGGLVQWCFYGLSLIWVSVAIGLTSLHVKLQNEESVADPLTGLYNRSYLAHYQGWGNRKRQVTGILLDINNFKGINDTYGHIEGDRVLREMGKMLRCAEPGAPVIRYGGDEFMVLLENASDEQIRRFRETLNRELQRRNETRTFPVPVSVSMGVAQLHAENFDAFFQEMDQNMYKEKQRYYRRMARCPSGKEEVPAVRMQEEGSYEPS